MPVFTDSRKIQATGSSLAMTLPSFFVKANEIVKWAEVKVLYGLKGVLIVYKTEDALVEGIDEIMNYLEVRK